MSEVRGSGQEYQTATAQEQPRGATPHPRPGAASRRSYPTPEARGSGWEDLPTPKARGGGWQEQPHLQGAVAAQAQEGLEELSHIERKGGSEEIPLVQGKEHWLRFAGAAVKR